MSGGLAPVGKTPDEVYQATFRKVIERNKAYYSVSARYPIPNGNSFQLCKFHGIRNF